MNEEKFIELCNRVQKLEVEIKKLQETVNLKLGEIEEKVNEMWEELTQLQNYLVEES